jgi:hypothetical protein
MKLRYFMNWYNDEKKDSMLFYAESMEFVDPELRACWRAELKKPVPDSQLTSDIARQWAIQRPYNNYLALALQIDYPGHHPEDVDIALAYITKLERGELEEDTCFCQAFTHIYSRTTVTFEHAIFSECYEWPNWSCSLAEYKAALEAWRVFITQPQHIDNEMIVELPERPLHIEHNILGQYDESYWLAHEQ